MLKLSIFIPLSKKNVCFNDKRPKTAPLQRHVGNNNNKIKHSKSTVVFVNSTTYDAVNAKMDENSEPARRKTFEKYVASVPAERKRKNPNHATYLTGSPIRINKGINPSKLALMRVRKRLSGEQQSEASMRNKQRYSNSNKGARTSPLLKKKSLRPKSALPTRKLFTPSSSRSSSKFNNNKRPQSALPKTGPEAVNWSLTASETTELEDEYLIDAFDEKEEGNQKANDSYEGRKVEEKMEEEEEQMFFSDDDEEDAINNNNNVRVNNDNDRNLEMIKKTNEDEIEILKMELTIAKTAANDENTSNSKETNLAKLKKKMLPIM